MIDDHEVTVGFATDKGPRRSLNADAVASYRYKPSGAVAVALVDGSGSSPEVAEFAALASGVAVRIAARKGAMPGVLAATELNADPTVEFPKPDGAIVVAVARPGQPIVIAHAGDSGALGFVDDELTWLTKFHTKGQRMREQGIADESEAAKRDNVLVNSIGRATVGTIPLIETFASAIVLGSDGVLQRLSLADMNEIVKNNPDPSLCAKELVTAARSAGSTDDATVLVLKRIPPNPNDKGVGTGR